MAVPALLRCRKWEMEPCSPGQLRLQHLRADYRCGMVLLFLVSNPPDLKNIPISWPGSSHDLLSGCQHLYWSQEKTSKAIISWPGKDVIHIGCGYHTVFMIMVRILLILDTKEKKEWHLKPTGIWLVLYGVSATCSVGHISVTNTEKSSSLSPCCGALTVCLLPPKLMCSQNIVRSRQNLKPLSGACLRR